MASDRDTVVGLVAIRAERRSWSALTLGWLAVGISAVSLAISVWRWLG